MTYAQRMTKQKIKVISNDEIYEVRKHDWNSLKSSIRKIDNPSQFISTLYSILFGAFLTTFFTLFTLSNDSPSWVKPSFIAFMLSTLLVSIVLFILEKNLIKNKKNNAKDLLSDMESIEKLF